MTRKEASMILYNIINSGIIDSDIEDDLQEMCDCICADSFEDCDIDERCKSGYPNYCEGCKHLKEEK